MYTTYVIANIYEKKIKPSGLQCTRTLYIDCPLLLHKGERETRVTGDEAQGTSGYEPDIKALNVPAMSQRDS